MGGGFTLIELLVTLALVGLLAAIALPSYLSQTIKARQAEAKTAIGDIVRFQLLYRTESPRFAGSLNELGIARPQSPYYRYSLRASTQGFSVTAQAQDRSLRGYSGGAVAIDTTLESALCQTPAPGTPARSPRFGVLGSADPCRAANMERIR